MPIFGALFRDVRNTRENSHELLMFISPKILNPERAFLEKVDKEKSEAEEEEKAKSVSSSSNESVPDDLF